MPTLKYEKELGGIVIGIDEAGRGPLAGPVYAAAVHLPVKQAARLIKTTWSPINDSKKLTERRRDELAEIIKSTPGCYYATAFATPQEIDELNILRATHLAMRRAALELAEQILSEDLFGSSELSVNEDFRILVDGLPVPTLPFPSQNLIKGDSKSLLIAAASILAKTARDAYCLEMDKNFPQYGFAKHKGYGTKAHLDALKTHGPCPEHRLSFAPVLNAGNGA